MTDGRPLRAVVCGTAFGQVYLEAFRTPGLPVTLAGVLARGGERSRACARRYGVPLFTDPDALPDDIDIGCVVVRGGLLGGPGSDLAARLMARSVHVLQEHPLHQDELAANLRTARRHGVSYRLTTFYRDLAPVRRFLGAARELLARRRPAYLDAACAFQVAYALLDILGAAVGRVRPWTFDEPATGSDADRPLRTIGGVFGGVPLTLRIQHELDPADPDAGAHLLHQVTLGTDAGGLSLATTHGPVLWQARPRIPTHVRDDSAPMYEGWRTRADNAPLWSVLGSPVAPGHRTTFGALWPAAAARTLRAFAGEVTGGADPLKAGAVHLELCRVWQDLAARLGPPRPPARPPWQPLADDDLAALAKAGDESQAWSAAR